MNETLIEEEVCYSVNQRFGLYERWTLSVYVLKRQQIRRQMNFEYLFKFHIPQSKLASKIATQIATQLWGLYAHCSVFNQFSLEVPLAPKCVIVWINHKSYTFPVIGYMIISFIDDEMTLSIDNSSLTVTLSQLKLLFYSDFEIGNCKKAEPNTHFTNMRLNSTLFYSHQKNFLTFLESFVFEIFLNISKKFLHKKYEFY